LASEGRRKKEEERREMKERENETWLIHWIALSSRPSVNMAKVRERNDE